MNLYNISHIINRELIEENVSDEEIFEFYLYPVNFNTLYKNKFREDNKAGCKYYISKGGNLYFTDKSWGITYNCYSVVMATYKCNFHQALLHIYEDMIEGKPTNILIDQQKIKKERIENHSHVNLKIKVKPFTSSELAFWNIGGLSVTEEELNDSGIYSISVLWENDIIHENCKHVFAYVENKKVVQIYLPLNKSKGLRRFINTSGFTVSNVNKIKDEKSVFVFTESRKCQFYLNKFGIPSEYFVNSKITLDRALYERIKSEYQHIFYLADNDRAGKHSAWIHRKLYGITPLFIPRGFGKDFTEYIININNYQEIIDEIENLKKQYL